MWISRAELRFLHERIRGLFRRGMTSLRTRGLKVTWLRLLRQFRRGAPIARPALYLPTASAFAPFDVPTSSTPRASIIIPVYNQCGHTLACLRALAAHPAPLPHEIIVVDDGSSDDTALWMPQVAGLRYHRRQANGGFIAACNDGARLARGDYLVFLNNDTLPQPGWLEALTATFSVPGIGLAGAQLIYPDGRLQEAGGVVFNDGTAWNYGRFESPDDPRHAYLRDADYCSGAALAIPAALFHAVGGFDTRYAPAYYEDTDLAFAVRALGYRVVYQPLSKVVHLEGVTAGTDPSSGVKAWQEKNRLTFQRKWANALASHSAPDRLPEPAWVHGKPREVLVMDEHMPQPDRDSASLRQVNLMRLLVEEGAHVVFVPTDLQGEPGSLPVLQQAGVETWHRPWLDGVPAWLKQHGRRFDVILLSRHYVAAEMLPLVRKYAPRATVVFDSVDLHYLRESREAELKDDALLRSTAERTRVREHLVIDGSDVTLVVSPVEQRLLRLDKPQARVELVSNLHAVSTECPPHAERKDLVFVGGFRHPPNRDAVLWFLRSVFPLVRRELPEVLFHCIGSDPDPEILAAGAQEGVVIHGHVADLLPFLQQGRVAVAPLRYGAGVKGKVNQSMAHGQPVVATPCAAEGMQLEDGKDVLLAEDAEAFAAAIVHLYASEQTWTELSRNSRLNVQRHFSLDSARETVRKVFF